MVVYLSFRLSSEPLLYLGAIATGALLTGVVYAVIKPKATE